MKVVKLAKSRSRPSRPRRRKLAPITLAEDIAIARGIAADPDARELARNEIRRMRPFYEAIVMRELGRRYENARASGFLVSVERDAHYLAAARAAAERFGHPAILDAAERAVSDARSQRESKRR